MLIPSGTVKRTKKNGLLETQVPLAGSFIINNTTYSGADIKVVVNLYDPGRAHIEQLKQLEDELRKVQDRLDRNRRLLFELRSKIADSKVATPLWFSLSAQIGSVGQQIIEDSVYLQEQQDHLKKLRSQIPKVGTKVLAEAQTLSVSTHRDKQAVRSCGTVYPKGFTRGPRQIAGSIVFTVFDEHVLWTLMEAHASDFDATAFTASLLDQLPPVDILISFANEHGSVSRMSIHGVEFIDEGQVMSIEDIITENTVNLVARDIDPMRSVSERKRDEVSAQMTLIQPKRASDLILEEDYLSLENSINPYTRFRRRRNPFL